MGNLVLATKTLAAINAAIEKDQGGLYRQTLAKVLPHIGDAYQGEQEPFRGHLGASVMGGDCDRKIWYGFHWATRPKFDGRMLRLFNRGHLEEGRIISLFLIIGCQIYQQDANGKQFRISFGEGHGGGSGDGIVVGLPDLQPGQAALIECKTHNEKSFKSVVESGVRESKFEHFVQSQTYMRKMGFAVTLYVAVNKNDDSLHLEFIFLDEQLADSFIARAERIIVTDKPPERICKTPGAYKARFCNDKQVCFGLEKPDRNCRTCSYAGVRTEGKWVCQFQNPEVVLPKERQLIGCEHYRAKLC